MALIKSKKSITLSDIKAGQVLEIKYDGDIDLILVVDPDAQTVTSTSQGRAGKLHAIKLKQLVETDLINLIKIIRSIKNVNPRLIYDTFKISPYVDGKRNYRTYTREKIGDISKVIVGQTSKGTNKIKIGNSILYGVVHGNHVEVSVEDYDTFGEELNRIGNTFYEGSTGHELVTQQLMELTIGKVLSGKSWEPESIPDSGKIGEAVAGWWNQSITEDNDGGVIAITNIRDAWTKTGLGFDVTIGQAFKASVRDLYSSILKGFKSYNQYGRYSKTNFLNTLNQRGFDDNGNATEALKDFNSAGHDQVFPEDNNLPPGPLKKGEQAFNLYRDEHLINLMETQTGIYFSGSGHLDNIHKILKTRK